MLKEKVTLVEYTKSQDRANCITHAIGAVMGLVALIIGTVYASHTSNVRIIAAAVIYGLSIIILFSASATYHGLPAGTAKKYARVIDHSMIFLIIAGTATPCSLVVLYECGRGYCWLVFSIAWLSCIVGMLSAVLFFEKTKALRMALLIGESLVMICSVLPIRNRFDTGAYGLLWVGCIILFIGAILYGIGKKNPIFHTVFHVFVLVGVGVHLYAIITHVFMPLAS